MVGMTRNVNKFIRDVNEITMKLISDVSSDIAASIENLRDKLIEMHIKGLVKINHSVMELVVAKKLLLKGYRVDVEHRVSDKLICDVWGVKGDGKIIVEVETGYTPPEHALDPTRYIRARIASKIARYSNYANKFSLAFPPFYFPEIPSIYVKPPRFRCEDEILEVKKLCDFYYKDPPVSFNEILNARLHTIFIIDVDIADAIEIDPETYYEMYRDYSRNILKF